MNYYIIYQPQQQIRAKNGSCQFIVGYSISNFQYATLLISLPMKGVHLMNNNTKQKLSNKAEEILSQLTPQTKRGDLRKIAKEIKVDHPLAMELWSTGDFIARLLAILIMDKKQLTEAEIDQLVEDMESHESQEGMDLMDWLFANQLAKQAKTLKLIETWQNSPLTLQRRTFWYQQGRLRWTGKESPDNTAALLDAIETNLMQEEPEVQWAMNFTAGWIGVYDERFRDRCIQIGEKTGLYKGDKVSKGCTPNYLPEFIEMEYNKRNKN